MEYVVLVNMQDLRDGNYMIHELGRTRRGIGRCSLYVIWSQDREKELSSNRSWLYSRDNDFRPDYSMIPPKST